MELVTGMIHRDFCFASQTFPLSITNLLKSAQERGCKPDELRARFLEAQALADSTADPLVRENVGILNEDEDDGEAFKSCSQVHPGLCSTKHAEFLTTALSISYFLCLPASPATRGLGVLCSCLRVPTNQSLRPSNTAQFQVT